MRLLFGWLAILGVCAALKAVPQNPSNSLARASRFAKWGGGALGGTQYHLGTQQNGVVVPMAWSLPRIIDSRRNGGVGTPVHTDPKFDKEIFKQGGAKR